MRPRSADRVRNPNRRNEVQGTKVPYVFGYDRFDFVVAHDNCQIKIIPSSARQPDP